MSFLLKMRPSSDTMFAVVGSLAIASTIAASAMIPTRVLYGKWFPTMHDSICAADVEQWAIDYSNRRPDTFKEAQKRLAETGTWERDSVETLNTDLRQFLAERKKQMRQQEMQ